MGAWGREKGMEKGEGRREKGEGRREKGEGRKEKGEGRSEKGEGGRKGDLEAALGGACLPSGKRTGLKAVRQSSLPFVRETKVLKLPGDVVRPDFPPDLHHARERGECYILLDILRN
jgi:hypothetical protein